MVHAIKIFLRRHWFDIIMSISFGKHVTPIGRVPGWRIGEGLPYMEMVEEK